MSEHVVEQIMDGLASMCVCSDRAEALSNDELADALMNVVWAELDMRGWPSALVDEAINRLRSNVTGEPSREKA